MTDTRCARIQALLADVQQVRALALRQRDDAEHTIRGCDAAIESLRALLIELTVEGDLAGL